MYYQSKQWKTHKLYVYMYTYNKFNNRYYINIMSMKINNYRKQ